MAKWGGRPAARLVQLVLATYGTRCHLCGGPGADSADHLIPRSRGGADTLANLRPAHHNVAPHCNRKRGDMPLEDWRKDPATVVIVCGPPAGGKSTYVAERAQTGDVIVDLDAIALALQPVGAPTHDHARHVHAVALAARSAAVAEATKIRRPVTVWVINTHPTPQQLHRYAAQGWEVVTVDPGQAEALARAHAAGRPRASIDALNAWYAAPPRPTHTTSSAAAAPSREWFHA